jgi:hypothetical protein
VPALGNQEDGAALVALVRREVGLLVLRAQREGWAAETDHRDRADRGVVLVLHRDELALADRAGALVVDPHVDVVRGARLLVGVEAEAAVFELLLSALSDLRDRDAQRRRALGA